MTRSVINSARTSSASVLDLVGTTANAANQFISTAARSIDALDAKVSVFHRSVIVNSKLELDFLEDRAIMDAASSHVDFLEEHHRRNFPEKPFDRDSALKAALARAEQALKAQP